MRLFLCPQFGIELVSASDIEIRVIRGTHKQVY